MTGCVRRQSRLLAALILGAAALVASSCSRDSADSEPAPAISTQTSIGPVKLGVDADRTELRAADRVRVNATLEWEAGAQVEPIELPVESAGWTLISREDSSPHVSKDGKLSRTTRFILEPGLPGDYEIPPARAAWTTPDGRSGVAQTEPLALKVTPLLDDSADLLTLSPEREIPPAPVPQSRSTNQLIIAGAVALPVIFVLAAVTVWLILRSRPTPASPLRARLRALEDAIASPCPEPRTLCDAAAATLQVAPPDAAPPELRRRLDLARFAPSAPDPTTARDLARHTLDLFATPQTAEVAP